MPLCILKTANHQEPGRQNQKHHSENEKGRYTNPRPGHLVEPNAQPLKEVLA